MRKYYSVPLLFFFLAASLGLFLRWQFVAPTPGVHYTWVLHGHSHVMFLGWVTNALFLAFVAYYVPAAQRTPFLKFFWALQALVVAMMISFPLQGYGAYSIVFTTMHTVALMIFTYVFLRRTRRDGRISTWFARVAWIFFFASTAGPFSLGYLMASGLGQTVWSNFSIYYYLHFQYNGFFLFGIFCLFYQILEQHNIRFDASRAKKFGVLMAIACAPAYALSILFAHPGLAFNLIGAGAALLQVWAVTVLLGELKAIKNGLRQSLSRPVYNIFMLVFWGLVAKVLIQLVSAHPYIAETAYQLRPVIIAYLHLVLVGIITLFLLGWYMHANLVKASPAGRAVAMLLSGFFGSEICIILTPWWSSVFGNSISAGLAIFLISILLVLGSFLFYLSFMCLKPERQTFASPSRRIRMAPDKNQSRN